MKMDRSVSQSFLLPRFSWSSRYYRLFIFTLATSIDTLEVTPTSQVPTAVDVVGVILKVWHIVVYNAEEFIAKQCTPPHIQDHTHHIQEGFKKKGSLLLKVHNLQM